MNATCLRPPRRRGFALALSLGASLVAALSAASVARAGEEPEPAPAFDGPYFTDVAAERGLPEGFSHRNLIVDLDGDGWLDVVLDNRRVFRNLPAESGGGRRFVADTTLLGALGIGAAGRRPDLLLFADLDGDGRQDAVVGYAGDPGNPAWSDGGERTYAALQRGGRLVPARPAATPAAAGPDASPGAAGPEATKPAALVGPETLVAGTFLDFDRDGHLDVVLGSGYVHGGQPLEAYPLRLLRGLGDGRFEDVTEAAGLGLRRPAGHLDSRRPIYGVTAVDWNGNGWTDLLVCAYGRQRNLLYENQGDGTFREVGVPSGFAGDEDQSGVYPAETKRWWLDRFGSERQDELPFRANGNTFAAVPGDVLNRGRIDVFLAEITHAWAGPSSDRSSLLSNTGPPDFRFERRPDAAPRAHEVPSWNQGDLYAAWFDFDNDGWLDLLVASGDYPDRQVLRLFRQGPPGTFRDVSEEAGLAGWDNCTQVALGDFDRDGAIDILIGNSNMRLPPERQAGRVLRVALFENHIGRRNHWLNVRLEGLGPARGGANRDAIGARVTVTAGDLRMTRDISGPYGHAGQSDAREAHFGLGRNARVDRLEVRWPNAAGTISVFEDLPADCFLVIREGAAAPVTRGPF